MALAFPASPTPGQQYTGPNGVVFEWDNSLGAWVKVNSVQAATAGTTAATGAARIPSGPAAARPTSPATGFFRFNEDTDKLEVWNGLIWAEVASSNPVVDTFVPQTTPITGTASAVIPAGNTANRQTNPLPLGGYTRFNTDTTLMEVFDGTIWTPVGAPPNAGLGLNLSGVTPNQILKLSVSQQSTPPVPGTLAAEAINGSLYWDDVLSQLFIRYANGGSPTWVAAAPSAGSLAAATLAEAQAGTINLKYSSPETAVPKNAAGMTGSAYIPAGNTAARPAAGAYVGQFRYNTQIPQLEYSDGVSWLPVGAAAATLAEAAAGVLTTKYSSPETAVPKTPSGMTGAALIPGSGDGGRPAAVTGMLRYNNQAGTPVNMEYYDGVNWTGLAKQTGGNILANVSFDGTPATPTIKGSSNVSSVTKVSAGVFTVSFITPASNTNYSVVGSSATLGAGDPRANFQIVAPALNATGYVLKTVSQNTVVGETAAAGALNPWDCNMIFVTI